MANLKCDVCGESAGMMGTPFVTNQQIAMHKFRAHGIRKNPPKKKAAPKLPKATKQAAKQHMQTLQWTELVDDNGSGRRLFVDENDDWWVAKKLDF